MAASKVVSAGSSTTVALLLSLNLLFFSVVSANHRYNSCPRDALKLGVCANVLNILRLKIGTPPRYPCCSLLNGLVDLEAAVCLCTALKADILGIVLNLPVDLSLLLNFCGKKAPRGFKCA